MGTGVRYVDSSWVNIMKVPSYTLWNASVGYDLTSGLMPIPSPMSLTLRPCASLNFCYMGEERNVSATVSYQF
ncbi:putative outer membrane protein [Pseudomonas sp. LP_7_YM]|nr:putative outer membrane protein [Pseudomonas sp. LP_7_YM]